MTWILPLWDKLILFFFILIRLSSLFLASPFFGNRSVPISIRVTLALMFSFFLLPLIPLPTLSFPSNSFTLMGFILQEIVIGVLLGFVVSLIVQGVQMAGELIGIQLGFSIASILDPQLQDSTTVIASFYIILASFIFLYLNGHHVVLTALAKSFEVLPVMGSISLKTPLTLVSLISKTFIIAIQMASPLLVVMTVLTIIFGLITKLSPQMNIYFNIGFILGPLVGLTLVMMSLPLFRVLMTTMTEELAPNMMKLLVELKAAP